MNDVVIVGSFVQDLAFQTSSLPAPGETRIGKFFPGPGGKGFNQAIACHRQNINTKFIGALGSDIFSASLHDFIKQENIEVALQKLDGLNTGVASIVVDSEGQNQIIVDLGANKNLDPDFVEKELGFPKVVLAQVESNLDSAYRALHLGRQRAALTILNPAPINDGINKELISLAEIITPNETEFSFLHKHLYQNSLKTNFWETPAEELQKLCCMLNVPVVVLTLGSKGCFISMKNDAFFLPPINVQVKDTTGAGDAFSGGLAAGLIKFNNDIRKAAQFATIVAGLSTEKAGTAPAMPQASEVKQRLSKDFL